MCVLCVVEQRRVMYSSGHSLSVNKSRSFPQVIASLPSCLPTGKVKEFTSKGGPWWKHETDLCLGTVSTGYVQVKGNYTESTLAETKLYSSQYAIVIFLFCYKGLAYRPITVPQGTILKALSHGSFCFIRGTWQSTEQSHRCHA